MKKKRIITGLAVTAAAGVLLAGGYLLWCRSLGDNVIWEPYTVNGVSIQGMTKKEAAAAVEEKFEEDFQDSRITLRIAGEEFSAKIFPLLAMDVSPVIDEAYAPGHGEWYTRGRDRIRRAREKEKTTAREVQPYIAHPEKAEDIVNATGIQKVNTLTETACELQGTSLTLHKGKTGVTADTEKLAERIITSIEKQDYAAVIDCPVNRLTPKDVDLQPFYDKIYQKVVNASYVKTDGVSVLPSAEGVSFDVKEGEETLEKAEEGETVTIPFLIQRPAVTDGELREKLFRDVLGSYTTAVSGTAERITNVELAARACDGAILMPGEIFSYNDTVGERTSEKGYQSAIVYESGQSVMGIGGGICQVSSTLFAAGLYADLDIVKRFCHSKTVAYLPPGMDATVSWGGPDYQFCNNTDYPLKLSVVLENGELTTEILGTKETSGRVEVTPLWIDSYTVKTMRNHYDSQGNLVSSEEVAQSRYQNGC